MGRPRVGGDRDIVIRCADCERETGRAARIGFVYWFDNEWLHVRDPRADDTPSIELVGAESVRYFCKRCEKRTGRRSYKVAPQQFFRDVATASGQQTRTLTI